MKQNIKGYDIYEKQKNVSKKKHKTFDKCSNKLTKKNLEFFWMGSYDWDIGGRIFVNQILENVNREFG